MHVIFLRSLLETDVNNFDNQAKNLIKKLLGAIAVPSTLPREWLE